MRKRKKKNMYDDASLFDVHAFIQSRGAVEHVNSVPVVQEAPVETDLEIIVDEIKEWFDHGRSEKMFAFSVGLLHAVCTDDKNEHKKFETELRQLHRDHKITDFLWKRRKKK